MSEAHSDPYSGETACYTNKPPEVCVLPGGHVLTDRPVTVFANWTAERHFYSSREGALAVRWARNGKRFFESGDSRHVISDDRYLLYNEGRVFSSYIDSPTPVSCSTVMFDRNAANDALYALVTPDDHLLDRPERPRTLRFEFVEGTYRHDEIVSPILHVGCMSPHHFIRLFKQLFKETPHQYLIRRRLEEARKLLSTTNQSVTEICAAVGCESLGSFSWLFRQRIGVSPKTFRRCIRTMAIR